MIDYILQDDCSIAEFERKTQWFLSESKPGAEIIRAGTVISFKNSM